MQAVFQFSKLTNLSSHLTKLAVKTKFEIILLKHYEWKSVKSFGVNIYYGNSEADLFLLSEKQSWLQEKYVHCTNTSICPNTKKN